MRKCLPDNLPAVPRIIFLYALLSGLWIFLFARLAGRPHLATLIGLFLIAITSFMLYRVVHSYSEALRQSEQRLRRFYNSGLLGVISWNMNGQVTDANDKFLEIIGYSREELASGKIDWVALTPPKYREDDRKALAELQATGVERVPREKEFLRKDGSLVPVIVAGATMEDAPFEGVAFVLDISLRKEAEAELLRAHALMEERVRQRTAELAHALESLKNESAERLKMVEELREKDQILIRQNHLAAMGELMSSIAHHWRQPLNVLGLIVQEISLSYGRERFNAQYLNESAAMAMEVISNLSRTIDDFRYFFATNQERSVFKVKDVLSKAVALLQEGVKNEELKLDLLIDDEELAVEGYQADFFQVLVNIVKNAKDACLERQVSAPRIVVHQFKERGNAVVTVSDNAGGVPPPVMGRIFEPYFTTRGPDRGTGIGLYMAKTIVERNMHGRLSLRNTAQGAEFRIEVETDAANRVP